jgi:hypothetical protein
MKVAKLSLSQKKNSVLFEMSSRIIHLSEIFVEKSQGISRLSKISTVIVVFVTKQVSLFVDNVQRQMLVQNAVKKQPSQIKK